MGEEVLLKFDPDEIHDVMQCIKWQKVVSEDSARIFEEKEDKMFYSNAAIILSDILKKIDMKSTNKGLCLTLSNEEFETLYCAVEIMVDPHLNRTTGELDTDKIELEEYDISLITLKKVYEALRNSK